MRLPAAFLFTASTVLASPAVHAHHSQAQFDSSQMITVEGTVLRFEWANPHVYIVLEQATENGQKIEWLVEAAGTGPLRRLGWSRDTLLAGDAITVTGRPSRRPDTKALNLLSLRKGERALFESQDLLGLFTTANDAPAAAAKGLDGVWATLLAMDVVVRLAVAPKASVALTPAGEAALDSYDEATMSPALTCVPQPAPFFMFVPDLKRVTTNGAAITIAGEYDDTERTIHMDALDHDEATPTLHGHSIGQWVGETLVIDTVAFSDHRTGNAFGVPSGKQKHLVERLTRNADATRLTYEFELTDPEYLADSITGRVEWAHRPGPDFERQACDLASARRFIEE